MTLQTLENTALPDILKAFNRAFSDYIVPMELGLEQLERKIAGEGIRMELCAGAFENDELIGFILHGYGEIDGKKTAYNAGTGVIPEKRGRKITGLMYDFILPVLEDRGIGNIVLEVITENQPAIKTYQKAGFEIVRTLKCYRGLLQVKNNPSGFEIRSLENYNWELLMSFWDWKPSWQNSVTAMENLRQSNISIGAYDRESLAGYAIYNPKTKRIQQFAVHPNYRNKGIGRQLFEHVAAIGGPEISLINVDKIDKETTLFLAAMKLECYIRQYEMVFMIE